MKSATFASYPELKSRPAQGVCGGPALDVDVDVDVDADADADAGMFSL